MFHEKIKRRTVKGREREGEREREREREITIIGLILSLPFNHF